MIADVQIDKQWNFNTYSQNLDNAITVASGLKVSGGINQLPKKIMEPKFVLVEEDSHWDESELMNFDKKNNSLEEYGYRVIKIDGYSIYLRSIATQMIFASLDKHKGKSMSADSKRKFKKLMSEFNNLPVVSAFSTYSVINKIVKTRMRITDYLAFNTTYFEYSESDELSFSIECDNEFILAGSGNASELSKKFAQLINELTDERVS